MAKMVTGVKLFADHSASGHTIRMPYRHIPVSQKRCSCPANRILRHRAGADSVIRRDRIHNIRHRLLNDGAKASGAGLALQGLLGDQLHSLRRKFKLYAVQVKQLLILLYQSILRLCQDADQGLLIQHIQRLNHRHTADELRNQPEFNQVLRHHLL